jgi:hypothetical protein
MAGGVRNLLAIAALHRRRVALGWEAQAAAPQHFRVGAGRQRSECIVTSAPIIACSENTTDVHEFKFSFCFSVEIYRHSADLYEWTPTVIFF